MNRRYHPYDVLEETSNGMWRSVCGSEMKALDSMAIDFMRDIKKFSAAMHEVICEWKYSCEHNLTSVQSNRIAWLGQAAVCAAIGAPESCARVGWYQLTEHQKEKANKAAEHAIKKWESLYIWCGMVQMEMKYD